MTNLGYFAAAGLVATGGIKHYYAKVAENENLKFEEGLKNPLPKNGEVSYVALQCVVKPLPSDSSTYFYRVLFTQSLWGIFPVKTTSEKVIPNPIQLESRVGTVKLHRTASSVWADGYKVETLSLRPLQAIVKKIALEHDSHDFIVHRYVQPFVTVFGEISNKNGEYSFNSDTVITSLTPKNYVASLRYQTENKERNAYLFGLGGVIVGANFWTNNQIKKTTLNMTRYVGKPARFWQSTKIVGGLATIAFSTYSFLKVGGQF